MTDVKNSALREAAPAGNPNSYGTKEAITAYLRGVDPAAVTASGQAYLDLADCYDSAMTELRGFAHDLANAWKGPASNAAQGQLRELFIAAFQISSRSQQTGTAVKTHGASYLAWYRGSMPTPKTLEEARQWMQGANQRATETWSAIPADISTNLPPIQSGRRELGSPAGGGTASGSGTPGGDTGFGGPGGTGAGGSAAGRTGGTHLSNHSGPPADGRPSTHLSHSTPDAAIAHPLGNGGQVAGGLPATDGPGGTQLSGLSSGGANTDGPGMGRPGGYGVGGGFGPGGSAGVGLPPGSSGSALPGGNAFPLGTGGGFVSGPGAIGSGLGRSAMSTGGGAAAGRPGAPGAGVPGATGHGGRKDGERERGAWLPDDHAIWDEGIEAVPGVIGNAPPKPIESERPADEARTDEAVLLRRVLARLAELESRGDETPPPPPAPPRMEWTD